MKKVNLAVILTTLLYILPPSQATAQIAANALPTNLPGATTFIHPPEGFNALYASDEELATYGFPPRPNADADPKANAAWQKAMSSSKSRLSPQLELTSVYHGPAKGANKNANVSNTNTSSNNWSGSVSLTGATSYNKYSLAYYVVAEYVVPLPSRPMALAPVLGTILRAG